MEVGRRDKFFFGANSEAEGLERGAEWIGVALAAADDAPGDRGNAVGNNLIETEPDRREAAGKGGDERGVGSREEDGAAECAVANEGAEDVGIDGEWGGWCVAGCGEERDAEAVTLGAVVVKTAANRFEWDDAPTARADFLLFGRAPDGRASPDFPEMIVATARGAAVGEGDAINWFRALRVNAAHGHGSALGGNHEVAGAKVTDGAKAGGGEHAGVVWLGFARAGAAGQDGDFVCEGVLERGALEVGEGEAGLFLGPLDGGVGFDWRKCAAGAGEAGDGGGDFFFGAVVVRKLNQA